jgi:hypothetical protein
VTCGGAGHAKLANDGKGKCLGNILPLPILTFLLDKRLNLGITITCELVYFRQRALDEKDITFLLNSIPDAYFEAKDARQI